jgi:hypothetical protein
MQSPDTPRDSTPNIDSSSRPIRFELARDWPPDVDAIVLRGIEGEPGLSRSAAELDRQFGGAISATAKELGFSGILGQHAMIDIPDNPSVMLVGVGPMPVEPGQITAALATAVQQSRSLGLSKLATPVVAGTKLEPEKVLAAIVAGAEAGAADQSDFQSNLTIVTPLDFNLP